MRKRVPVLKDGKVLRDENGKVLEFDAVNQEELDRKIDAPQVAKVGEVLTVEEVDTDGKPKKWKTQTVETEPPDWNENDPTKPGYVKNRTHYDSRLENVELFNVTVENTSLPFIKVADVGIDVTKIVRIKMNVQVSVPDEGVRTIEVDSDEGEITQNDVDGDGSQIVTIIEKTTGDRTERHLYCWAICVGYRRNYQRYFCGLRYSWGIVYTQPKIYKGYVLYRDWIWACGWI